MSTGKNTSQTRCFTEHAPQKGPPLIQHGQVTFQAHYVGWIVASIFTVIATLVSFWLISKHLVWYTKKRQQRYIVRLLFMVPIYAIVSLASYIFWNQAIPITLLRDSYESFVLYSFFYLLLQYVSNTPDGQREVFRKIKLKKWMFPLSFIKYRPDGLHFLQMMKWGVLQYCIVRPGTTVAAVITNYIGLYCDNSWSPVWAHFYVTITVSLSVTVAMYCLIQLYIPIAGQLSEHKPLLKLASVKAVVFLTFWQATFLSLLSKVGVVKDTQYMTANDINTGIAAILETFEMACFAFLHIRAFSYLPYKTVKADQTSRLRSLAHVIDIRDMWRELRDGSVYMGKTIRGVETDEEARRRIHFAKVMGRERCVDGLQGENKEDMALLTSGHQYLTNEHRRSTAIYLSESQDRFGADFQHEVEKELSDRNLSYKFPVSDDVPRGHSRGKSNRSWWRGVYERVSQHANEKDIEERRPSMSYHNIHSAMPSLDSPPPRSSLIFDFSKAGSRHSIHNNPSSYEAGQFPSDSVNPPATPPKPVRVTRASKRSHDAESIGRIPTTEKSFISKDITGPNLPSKTSVIPPGSVPDRLFTGFPRSAVADFTGFGISQDTKITVTRDVLPKTYPHLQRGPLTAHSRDVVQSRETSVSRPQGRTMDNGTRPRIVLPAPLSSAVRPSYEQHVHAENVPQQSHYEQAVSQEKVLPAEVSGNHGNNLTSLAAHHMGQPESGDPLSDDPNAAHTNSYPPMTNMTGAQQHRKLRHMRGDVGLKRDNFGHA